LNKNVLNIKNLRVLFSTAAVIFLLQACGGTESKEEAKDTSNEKTSSPVAESTPVSSGDLDGATLFALCQTCHGQNGEGNKEFGAPSIVNMEPWYMTLQIENFKDGIRGTNPDDANGLQMAAISKTLTSDAAVQAVIDHIESLPDSKPAKTLEGDVSNGEAYYNSLCGACHGTAGKGIPSLNSPSLVGINDWYLYDQFKNFQSGLRGAHEDDVYGGQMAQISSIVSADDDLLDIVAYLQSL
jgi:cytochrome c oxidase subunit 2